LFEGGFADRVVDDREAAAIGDFLNADSEVFFRVEDDLVGSGCAGEGGFFVGGDSGDDASAEILGHLDKEEAGAAGSGVNEDLVTALDLIGGVSEVVCREALCECRGGLLEGDALRNGNEPVGRSNGELGVGSGDSAPCDSVTGLEGSDIGSYCDDDAGGFLTKGVREMCGVAAFTEVGVDEVDAGRFDADESFTWAWRWCGKIAEGEYVCGACGKDLDSLHGGCQSTTLPLPVWSRSESRENFIN